MCAHYQSMGGIGTTYRILTGPWLPCDVVVDPHPTLFWGRRHRHTTLQQQTSESARQVGTRACRTGVARKWGGGGGTCGAAALDFLSLATTCAGPHIPWGEPCEKTKEGGDGLYGGAQALELRLGANRAPPSETGYGGGGALTLWVGANPSRMHTTANHTRCGLSIAKNGRSASCWPKYKSGM